MGRARMGRRQPVTLPPAYTRDQLARAARRQLRLAAFVAVALAVVLAVLVALPG